MTSRKGIKTKCLSCEEFFMKPFLELKRTKLDYCCRDCYLTNERRQKIIVNCNQCGKEILKQQKEINRGYKNYFCCQSCAAIYRNTHKKHGTKVSKLEKYLQEKLVQSYDFEFHFNRKDTINSELDIYIPELKLAFELNGVFHYEPIFGEEKLHKIQNNDNRKFQACLEHEIELCIIDTSWIKYHKESNAKKVLDIIEKIISRNEKAGN